MPGSERRRGARGLMRPRRIAAPARHLPRLVAALLALHPGPAGAEAGVCDQFDLQVTTTPSLPTSAAALRRNDEIVRMAAARFDVVLVGDSITQLWPADILARTFPGRTVLNLGVGRDRIQNVLWRLETDDLSQVSPREVYVLAGTNNLTVDKPCAIVAGIAKLLGTLRRLWPAARTGVIGLLPRGLAGDAVDAERRETDTLMRGTFGSGGGARYLDPEPAFDCGPDRQACGLYVGDLVHLSHAGYEALGGLLRAGEH